MKRGQQVYQPYKEEEEKKKRKHKASSTKLRESCQIPDSLRKRGGGPGTTDMLGYFSLFQTFTLTAVRLLGSGSSRMFGTLSAEGTGEWVFPEIKQETAQFTVTCG